MSSKRCLNIYTLGSKEKTVRRQVTDPFERDPFKIQSYNFRYAERPSFQLPVSQQSVNNPPTVKDCQTNFYNSGFPSACHSRSVREAVLQNNTRALNLFKFQEYRRRKFLNESVSSNITGAKANSSRLSQSPGSSAALSSCFDRRNVKTSHASLRRNLSQLPSNSNSLSHNIAQPEPTKPSFIPRSTRSNHGSLTSTGLQLNRSGSLGSGCEININIKGLEKNGPNENVNIKIESDSMSRNLNIPLTQTSQHSTATKSKLKGVNSFDTFVIEKRLAKFSPYQDRQNDLRKTTKDRVKELTSIYSSQMLSKPTRSGYANSTERSPSLMPFKSWGSKENFNSKVFKSVQDNISDNIATRKKISYNNLNSPYSLGSNENNASNFSALTANPSVLKTVNSGKYTPVVTSRQSTTSTMPSSSQKLDSKSTATLRLHSSGRLPLNVNINVYTDGLKILRV